MGTPDLTTARGVQRYMKGARTIDDWNRRCSMVKAANNGDYPSFWVEVAHPIERRLEAKVAKNKK
jgi:hypothetical protein